MANIYRWCDVPIVMNPAKVAEVCEVGRDTVTAWLNRKSDPLPHRKTEGQNGRYIISRDALRVWLMGAK